MTEIIYGYKSENLKLYKFDNNLMQTLLVMMLIFANHVIPLQT